MPGIVVGFDGSSHSSQALEWAVKHAALEHVPLTVLAVHEVMTSNWTGNPVVYPEDSPEVEKARQAAQDGADEALGELGDGPQPQSVTVRAVNGNPAQALVEASEDADLVVVGSRGVGGFAGIATGSVTAKVVNHSACPVVVIRHK